MTWLYNDAEVNEIDSKYVAFVYLITNNITGKQYIGKKTTIFSRKKKIKGKTKKKRVITESDWKDYWSSCDDLVDDVQKLGEENFKREILHFCLTKGTASYLEAREQFSRGVLENDGWYNGQIRVRCHRSHLKLLKI